MPRAPHILVGIDGGGTKTECAAVSVAGLGHCRFVSSGSNYQGLGIRQATKVWQGLLDRVLAHFRATGAEVAAAGLGLAGLDRPKDETVIRPALASLLGAAPFELVNDAYLALRAGTRDGIGVAVVSGTGCNSMGTARDGKRFRVGGIGPEFGDLGSATDIGTAGLRAAFRSLDDRGPPTMLVDLIMARLSLQRLDDLVDFFLADSDSGGEFDLGALAPLVFEAAGAGDEPCSDVLAWAGRELGISVRAVARNLFAPADSFPLVMGGAVLQSGTPPIVVDALKEDVHAEFPEARPMVLSARPVAGAVRYALDTWETMVGRKGNALSKLVDKVFAEDGDET